MQRIGSIYKITNKINGKIYIGLTTQKVRRRFKRHLSDAHRNIDSMAISRAIIKYGKENFCVEEIYISCCIKDLNNKEEYFISYYNSTDNNIGYNIQLGGNVNFMSGEVKQKISKANTGIKWSLEARERMSRNRSGKNAANYGKTTPDNVREKIRQAHLGKPKISWKNDLNKKQIYAKSRGLKPIYCIETNETFIFIKDAAAKCGIDPDTVRRSLLKNRQVKERYTFVYKELTHE